MVNYIWRVENKKGQGAYTYNGNNELMFDLWERHAQNWIKHPQLINETGIGRFPNKNEICGFISKQQAFNWFSKNDLILLKKVGYTLKRIKVRTISAIGKQQLLAIR